MLEEYILVVLLPELGLGRAASWRLLCSYTMILYTFSIIVIFSLYLDQGKM